MNVADLKAADAKLIQYLNEAYGKEKQLETDLQAHIAMTEGKDTYKKRLQDHLKETKAQSKNLERRIKKLGGKAELGPDCRKCARHFRLEEDVARGDGKGAFAMAGSQCRSKSQCVEMTAMIRGEHKRPVHWQPIAANDRQSVRNREITPNQRKRSMMRKALKKSAFAPHAAKAFAWSQTGVVGRLEVPRLHHSSQPVKICCCWPTANPTK